MAETQKLHIALFPWLAFGHIIPFLELAPDWIIHDFAPHWLPPIATKLGIRRVFFSVFNASFLCFVGPSNSSTTDAVDPTSTRTETDHFIVPPKWVPFPTKIAPRLFEAKKLIGNHMEENASGVSDISRYMQAVEGAGALAVKTCSEVEGEWLKLLGQLHNAPVFPVGSLPSSAQERGVDKDGTWGTIVEWLDKREKGSVVYVAFGTEVQPSQEDLNELALGLEQSGFPFFWALRKRSSSVIGGDMAELPEGFEERTRGRGIVWPSWAPQFRILAHESVGGFLNHCGWSSVAEAFQLGRPLIMLPISVDSGLIARLIEERQAGVEVPRNEQDGSFTRDSVTQTLRLVMKDEEGQIYRDKAKEMSAIFGDEDLQDRYAANFVEFLENHRHVVRGL
ncbi:putative UDP-rhamnose:rhamnosyltransferase 1 [Morella rubra]|uniref:Putative UDP-rhamnose:rhamnosyltransferase 1 n=1 Tax=Morella rubra TaxID=262757 RepID=A0A6A1UN23_9ROSI|nr:putative UDP-rhamnose:rhamnosyltransferase 1 [Morella rubra]